MSLQSILSGRQDYEQKEAVYLAYELHKASMEENYNIEYALERILEKKENEMESIQPEKKQDMICRRN